jgi:hypothetical protein
VIRLLEATQPQEDEWRDRAIRTSADPRTVLLAHVIAGKRAADGAMKRRTHLCSSECAFGQFIPRSLVPAMSIGQLPRYCQRGKSLMPLKVNGRRRNNRMSDGIPVTCNLHLPGASPCILQTLPEEVAESGLFTRSDIVRPGPTVNAGQAVVDGAVASLTMATASKWTHCLPNGSTHGMARAKGYAMVRNRTTRKNH